MLIDVLSCYSDDHSYSAFRETLKSAGQQPVVDKYFQNFPDLL